MNISFSKVVEGYFLAAGARRLSKGTIQDYANTFRKFSTFLEKDPPMEEITPDDIRGFLAVQNVSKKTLLNYHFGLSALLICRRITGLLHRWIIGGCVVCGGSA